MSAPKTLTVTETHQLLDALLCKNGTHKQFIRGVRNYTMACLMLEAGLRVGEVVQMRWDHLYFNYLPVTSIIIPPHIAKRGIERQVPVSTRLSDALKTYFEHYGPLKLVCDHCFTFSRKLLHEPLTTRQVERFIRAAALRSIGRPVHPHILRHTFGTKLMRVTDIRTVQELLGHKHISSTQIYTHPNEDDKKKAIQEFDKSLTDIENRVLQST